MFNLNKRNKEKDISYLFKASLLLKGLHSIIEILGGCLVLFLTQNFLIHTILKVYHGELSEDPHDFFVNYLIHASQNFSINSKHFIVLYLLSHGIIRGVSVILLYKRKLWAYPASILIFGILMIYQLIRYFHTYSIWMIIFTLFDVLVLWLIWHEYKIQKVRLG